jgi:hypothetical protein
VAEVQCLLLYLPYYDDELLMTDALLVTDEMLATAIRTLGPILFLQLVCKIQKIINIL